MFILYPRLRARRGVKVAVIVALLAVLVFYVLPKLVLELWFFAPEEQRIYDRNQYPQPMRVELRGMANFEFCAAMTGKTRVGVEL